MLYSLIAFVRTYPNLVFLGHYGGNFRAVMGDCKSDVPTFFFFFFFIRDNSAGKLDSFGFDLFSVSDERGFVINDYL